LKVNENTAFAYIRSKMPDNWDYMAGNSLKSHATHNPGVYDQWNRVRQYARDHQLDLRRRFFDCERKWPNDPIEIPLSQREQLARLFVQATQLGVKQVLVDLRDRLEDDAVLRFELIQIFVKAGIRLIEVANDGPGVELTMLTAPSVAHLSATDIRAKRLELRRWKQLVARFRGDPLPGRKAFGESPDEQITLTKIRELYRILPRSQWRHRGSAPQKRRSVAQIAAALNELSIPTRTGKPWSGAVVLSILKRLKIWKES